MHLARVLERRTEPGKHYGVLTGMPRDEIVRRGVIGGSIPMYGLLGAVGLGAAVGDQ